MNLTGLQIGDAPKEPVAAPPASIVETATGVMNDPTKETPKVETPTADPSRPEGLPDKFKTTADLVKAYTELEKKLGAPKADTVVTPEAAIAKAGADMSVAEKEYAKDGKVSDATMTALEAKGLTKEVINNYFAGQDAVAKQTRAEFAQIAGGETQLDAVLKWAPTALTVAEAKAYQTAVDGGDVATAKLLFQGITARYVAANGSDPALVTTGTVPNAAGVQAYESWDQVVRDMSKPEYKTDPAFQKKVQARLGVSELGS